MVAFMTRSSNYKMLRMRGILSYLRSHWILYAMLLLPIVQYILFRYMPLYGLQIAFKDYSVYRGISESPWVGFDVFREVFRMPNFWQSVRNTMMLNVLTVLVGFPAPIILALLLNELRNGIFKKVTQTILYLPHFISWVIIGGMMYQIFSTSSGLVNNMLKALTGNTIPFLTNNFWWVFTYFLVSIWHDIGWSAIIFMSAMTGIDAEIYEAASVDGCSRFRMMYKITLPSIMPTIAIVLILKVGSLATIGFEQPLSMQNDTILQVGDVISTYAYRIGIKSNRFNIATAITFAQSVINFILVLVANKTSNKLTGEGLW